MVDTYGAVTRRNLATNPGLSLSTSGYFNSNGAYFTLAQDAASGRVFSTRTSTQQPMRNVSYVYLTGMDTTSFTALSVTPGKPYSLSAEVVPTVAGRTITAYLIFRSASGDIAGNVGRTDLVNAPAAPVRVGASGIAPANAVSVRLEIQVNAPTNVNTTGEVVYYDNVLVEQAATIGSYFDGDSSSISGSTFGWEGDPGASTSVARTAKVYNPLSWGTVGERFYETGVDRGVLYIDGVGYPWTGLTAVNEEPTGGEAKPYYIDGVKYQHRTSLEEFEATVEAYTYPEAFNACDGTLAIGAGLFATQQRRKLFSFSYRTKVGNDVDGIDHAYKLHLVYNARAEPSQREHSSIGDSIEPFNFSWKVTARAPLLSIARPTAHFVIDSRSVDADVLALVESLLYGTALAPPSLVTVEQLYYFFMQRASGIYDAGLPNAPYYDTYDGGYPLSTNQSPILDGGAP